jgi:UDP-3-O-[3-hydroxymyristoyl] glucosamine N-acyltransferase
LEDGAIAGAQAGIPTGKTIRTGQMVWGTPAREIAKFKEAYAWYARLPELGERVKEIERAISGKEERKSSPQRAQRTRRRKGK